MAIETNIGSVLRPLARERAPVPARRFALGVSLLVGAGVLAGVSSFLPWLTAPDVPGGRAVSRTGWDLFATFGVQVSRTLPQELLTGPVALFAAGCFLGAVVLLAYRRRSGARGTALLLFALGLVTIGVVLLLGIWRSVHEMAGPCGCDPDLLRVQDRFGVHLLGVSALLALVGVAACSVPGPASPQHDPSPPLGW
jgi:hypothetical protein